MRSAIARLAIALLLCMAASPVFAGSPLEVKLAVPPGVNPTIVTERDTSGSFRIVRVTETVFKLVNFDCNVGLVLSTTQQYQAPTVIVTFGGTNGPDPMPTVKLTVVAEGGGDARIERSVDLRPGDTIPCPGAAEVIISVSR